MTSEQLIGTVIIGLNQACFYLLMALGLTLMFGICGIINMAHGVFYMLGAFGVFYLTTALGMNFYLSLVLVMVVIGLAGLVMERAFFRPIAGEFAPTIVITIGFSILLEGMGYLFLFGPTARGMPTPIPGVSEVLGHKISNYRLAVFAMTVVLAGGLYYIIQKTKLGLAMRATEEDKTATALQGVNPNWIDPLVFFIGFALAGAAGGLMAPVYSLTPSMGALPLLKAFMVIIVGGMGNVYGAIVGSLVVGLMDSFFSVTVGAEISYIITWLIIIIILIFRPRGLFGAY